MKERKIKMLRLTKKEPNGIYHLTNIGEQYASPDDGSNACRLMQIIGAYEDIEEELGCSLPVLFEALKNGVWVKDLPNEDELCKYYHLKLSIVKNKIYLTDGVNMCTSTDSYRSSWWLNEDKSR